MRYWAHVRLLLPAALTLTVIACGKSSPSISQLGDIYTNDADTRRDASAEELQWGAYLTHSSGGFTYFCTGSMIAPTLLLTAEHCLSVRVKGARYRSGATLSRNIGKSFKDIPQDLEFVKNIEAGADSHRDYAIVQVKWLSGTPDPDQRYAPFITTKKDDVTLGKDGEATKLIAVGYPSDKQSGSVPNAIYAEGYAKGFGTGGLPRFFYNIGVVDGNSGGAIWRASDHMLISETNSGWHYRGQDGWDNNDPEKPGAWNNGPIFHEIYAKSKTLQDVFPDGNNRFVDDSGVAE